MQQQKFNYITCYRRKDKDVFIYLKDGTKFSCFICNSIVRPRIYLNFRGKSNDYLFRLLKIDENLLTAKLPGIYYKGDWPESRTEEELFDLLRALIKESKKRYYLATEL